MELQRLDEAQNRAPRSLLSLGIILWCRALLPPLGKRRTGECIGHHMRDDAGGGLRSTLRLRAQDLDDQIRHVAVGHRRWDAAAKTGDVVAVSVAQHQRIDDAGDVVGAAIQRRRRCAVTLGQQGLAGQDLRHRVRRPGRAGQHGNSQSRWQDESHGASNYDEAPRRRQQFRPP